MPTKHRTMIAILVMTLLLTGLTACAAQTTSSDPEAVVTQYLESERDNDYDAWVSTLIKEKQEAYTKEANGEFGVLSLSIESVSTNPDETQRMIERYTGSELAKTWGWSDDYLAKNMIVVTARYTVDYDNTKVPYNEGKLTQGFILVRDDENSPWLIWDMNSPSDDQ